MFFRRAGPGLLDQCKKKLLAPSLLARQAGIGVSCEYPLKIGVLS
jgi:hypothetical protein